MSQSTVVLEFISTPEEIVDLHIFLDVAIRTVVNITQNHLSFFFSFNSTEITSVGVSSSNVIFWDLILEQFSELRIYIATPLVEPLS